MIFFCKEEDVKAGFYFPADPVLFMLSRVLKCARIHRCKHTFNATEWKLLQPIIVVVFFFHKNSFFSLNNDDYNLPFHHGKYLL